MIVKKSKLLLLTIFLVSCTVNFSISNNTHQLTASNSYSLNISAINNDVDYLIITTEEFVPFLEPLAQWKTQKGVVSKIETISYIESRYSGGSLREQIKNCVRHHYNHNNTQWVLLAGDQNHVPMLNKLNFL